MYIKLLIIELKGCILVAWSLKVLLKIFTKPIAVFNFEDGEYPFEIQEPGYYSIAVLGARFIQLVQSIVVQITSDGDASKVRIHDVTFFSKTEGRLEIHCWGLSMHHAGSYTISFSNLDQIEAYRSMLISKRFFESPIDHSKLRIAIHRSVKPIYQLGGMIALILGVNLILYGIFYF